MRFVEWLLPCTNYKLKVDSLQRRKNNLKLKELHNMDDLAVKEVSEKIATTILGTEIKYFQDLEKLKMHFFKFHVKNINEIWKCFSFSEKGTLNSKA